MNVLVVGATGVLGRQVLPRLLERGHKVRAVVRRRDQAQFLQQMGAQAVPGDILDPGSLDIAARDVQAALHLATAIPKNGSQDWSMNDRIRREGTRNLLDALSRHGVRRYVQQSITLVYGEQGEEIVNESTALQATPVSQSAIEMEDRVRSSGMDWIILRGGLFYGPGTEREDGWWQSAEQGRLRIPGDGSDLISLVHVVDMARAVVIASQRVSSLAGRIYNIVDDQPVRVGDLFRHVAAQAGVPELQTGGPTFLPSLGVSNVRAQMDLGWRPAYPTFQTGLAYRGLGRAAERGSGKKITAVPHTTQPAQVQTEVML